MATMWDTLPKPIFSLAPMEDVTDTVFRQLLLETGRPDVFFTEFTNVDGMNSAGDEKVSQRLLFSPQEKPLIAQIWGMIPENFYKAAKRIVGMGFDGVDLNMGCPQHDVTRHGACSALIKNHSLAKEIIEATREGVREAAKEVNHSTSSEKKEILKQVQDDNKDIIPVSVKTRIGFSKIQTEEWLGFLLEQKLPLITVHGRTAAEMSKVPAHWDEIGKVVQMRNALQENYDSRFKIQEKGDSSRQARTVKPHTLIFGNGDVMSLNEAKEKAQLYGLDGIMIGRGIFHNPWLFAGIDASEKTLKDRLELLKKHVVLYQKTWGEKKNYQILKKYFKIYLSGFDGASDMRQRFMETNSYEEALELVATLS